MIPVWLYGPLTPLMALPIKMCWQKHLQKLNLFSSFLIFIPILRVAPRLGREFAAWHTISIIMYAASMFLLCPSNYHCFSQYFQLLGSLQSNPVNASLHFWDAFIFQQVLSPHIVTANWRSRQYSVIFLF